jgi:Fe-S cluster biogenesis protein NfuA
MRSLKVLLALSCGLLAGLPATTANAASAEKAAKKGPWADADHVIYSPAAGAVWGGPAAKACMINHGGPVITHAKVVLLFWGPSFGPLGADHSYATTLQAFRNMFGTTPEYNIVSEYGVIPGSLVGAQPDLFDLSTPPVNVTDAIVRSKVNSYLASHGGNDPSTVYEVFIPSTSYSSSGTSTSCGGPSLAYCSYHAWIGSGATATKYSIQPWPGCAGCSVSGWSALQNAEKLFVHETREAVTNPTGTGWWDSTGNELDDKCAWAPPPFIGTGGYSYQYGWGLRACKCIKSLPF